MSVKEAKEKEAREFTKRTLLSLANDIVLLESSKEAIVQKIRAMAIAHDLDLDDAA